MDWKNSYFPLCISPANLLLNGYSKKWKQLKFSLRRWLLQTAGIEIIEKIVHNFIFVSAGISGIDYLNENVGSMQALQEYQ